MTLQEQYTEKRAKYMSNQLTHNEFYLWLADAIGIEEYMLPFTVDAIRNSHDEHLNDLPLARWDSYDPLVRGLAVQHGMRSWSLSDTVCVLKAYARKVAA